MVPQFYPGGSSGVPAMPATILMSVCLVYFILPPKVCVESQANTIVSVCLEYFAMLMYDSCIHHCDETSQRYKFLMHFLQRCKKHKKKCNVADIACILRNVLRTGRMGTMQRLYKIHSKIATLYKTHRVFVTLI